MRFKITEGIVQRPQRLLIYGPEGIGKSTFASQMPDPLFVDVEDGSGHLPVRRLPVPPDWDTLLAEIDSVYEEPKGISTIVIDSVDAAERLCQAKVIERAKKKSIEAWGYGKGYVVAAEEYQNLLTALDRCIRRGVNVVMVAHSQLRKVERPDEEGAYDRFEVKLNKHVASKTKEWADAVLFLDYETFVSVDESGKGKASGGKRVIRTSHSVSWDAKNRFDLPDKLMLDHDGIMAVREHLPVNDGKASSHPNPELLHDMAELERKKKAEAKPKKPKGKQPPAAPKRLQPLFDKCTESGIRPDEVRAVMVAKGKREPDHAVTDWEEPFVKWLVKQWPKVTELVMEARKNGEGKGAEDVYDGGIPF